jgi:membrane fusion protein (multidrug efflux system)
MAEDRRPDEYVDNGQRRSRRRKALLIFAVVAVIVMAGGLFYRWYRSTHVSTDDAFVEGKVHPVSTRVQGKVVEVLVDDNQPVKKGQALLRIDPEPYAVRMDAADAALASASADLAAARQDVSAARSEIQFAREDLVAARSMLGQVRARADAARANVALAEATAAQARRDAERAKNLFEKNAVSRERYERAQTERDIARSRTEAAGEELRVAEAAIATQQAAVAQKKARLDQRVAALAQREAKVGQKEADMGQKRASLSEARLLHGYTDVSAPADGYVTRKNVEVGQVVSPGQPLLSVTSLSDIWIVANYKETELGRIRPGQPVSIKVDTFSGREFRGKVDSIMAGTGSAFSLFPPENATGNYVKVVQRVPVKIVLDKGEDPGHILRIGMSVVPTVLVR